MVEPVLVWRGSDEGKQAGKIGGDLERAQWTAHGKIGARRKGILDQGNGQELGQELYLDLARAGGG